MALGEEWGKMNKGKTSKKGGNGERKVELPQSSSFVLDFGSHAGTPLCDVPSDYLLFIGILQRGYAHWRSLFIHELEQRGQVRLLEEVSLGAPDNLLPLSIEFRHSFRWNPNSEVAVKLVRGVGGVTVAHDWTESYHWVKQTNEGSCLDYFELRGPDVLSVVSRVTPVEFLSLLGSMVRIGTRFRYLTGALGYPSSRLNYLLGWLSRVSNSPMDSRISIERRLVMEAVRDSGVRTEFKFSNTAHGLDIKLMVWGLVFDLELVLYETPNGSIPTRDLTLGNSSMVPVSLLLRSVRDWE